MMSVAQQIANQNNTTSPPVNIHDLTYQLHTMQQHLATLSPGLGVPSALGKGTGKTGPPLTKPVGAYTPNPFVYHDATTGKGWETYTAPTWHNAKAAKAAVFGKGGGGKMKGKNKGNTTHKPSCNRRTHFSPSYGLAYGATRGTTTRTAGTAAIQYVAPNG